MASSSSRSVVNEFIAGFWVFLIALPPVPAAGVLFGNLGKERRPKEQS